MLTRQRDGETEVYPGLVLDEGRLNERTVTKIEWSVRLANKKASWFQFQNLQTRNV